MKIIIQDSYDDLSKAAADYVRDYVQQKPDAFLCFPSGESPTGMLQYLVHYAQTGHVNFSQCTFVGLDEWVGMDENDEGSGRHYMYQHLFIPLRIPAERIVFFNAKATDLDQECKRINAFILEHGPLDIMMVGVGMNGHIGLNEPGVSFDSYAHHTALDEVTKTVGQKYFNRQTDLQEGITLGLKHLQEARVAVLIAAGTKKAGIVAQALEGEITNQVPASILQTHPNAIIFLDRAAAAKLSYTNSNGPTRQ